MARANRWITRAAVVVTSLLAGAAFAVATGPARSFGEAAAAPPAASGAVVRSSYGFGGYGYGFGYYPTFVTPPSAPPATSYLPKYWWTGYYGTDDPRQDGYNPNAGYQWEDVTTLILGTSPRKAEVTLDGSPIGSACDLGPIQLPPGDHTLRIEAAGFEPSEAVLKAGEASVRRLQINLKAVVTAAKRTN